MTVGPLSQDLFRFLDVFAVLVAGVMGGIVARQRRFDVVGFVILAILTALGGGMVRDLLLQTKPVAIWDPAYLPAALLGAIIAFLSPLDTKWTNRLLIVADAFVMGAWSGLGAVKALEFGTSVVSAVLLGILTGIGGGIIRDACIGQVPSVFGGNYLYAVPSVLSAVLATILGNFGYYRGAIVGASIFGAMFVILARWRRWQLPQTGGIVVSINLRQIQQLIRRAENRGRLEERNQALEDQVAEELEKIEEERQ